MSSATAPVAGRSFRLALVQLGETSSSKTDNLLRAKELVTRAAKGKDGSEGVDLVVLPECFNSLYGTRACRRRQASLPPAIALRSRRVGLHDPQNTLTRTPSTSRAMQDRAESRRGCSRSSQRSSESGSWEGAYQSAMRLGSSTTRRAVACLRLGCVHQEANSY